MRTLVSFRLGADAARVVVLQVLPVAYVPVQRKLIDMGAADAPLRMSQGGKAGPVVTDHGNFIIDANFEGIEGTNGRRFLLLPHLKEIVAKDCSLRVTRRILGLWRNSHVVLLCVCDRPGSAKPAASAHPRRSWNGVIHRHGFDGT